MTAREVVNQSEAVESWGRDDEGGEVGVACSCRLAGPRHPCNFGGRMVRRLYW
jgi:hypothetical protein